MFFPSKETKETKQRKTALFSKQITTRPAFFAPVSKIVQTQKNIDSTDAGEKNSTIIPPTVQKFSLSDVKEGLGDAIDWAGDQASRGIDYVRGRPERERPERERPERDKEDQTPDTNPANYCRPYTNRAELWASKAYAMTTLIPASAAMFGADVSGMWLQYLRGGGFRTFTEGSNIANSFKRSNVIQTHANRLMDIALTRLDKFSHVPANAITDVPVEDVFTNEEINFPLNFNNPFDIPGHIAGGASTDGAASSNFGPDTRKLKGSISVLKETDPSTGASTITLAANFEFEVHDAMDFCPGNPGAFMEQTLTVPLSRLEASGSAQDVGLHVNFKITELRRRIDTGLGAPGGGMLVPNEERRHGGDRQDVTRGMTEVNRSIHRNN